MGSKKIIGIFVVFVVIFAGIFLIKKPKGKTPLRVCTWSNYYPEDILKAFTDKTGIQLELSYISSNEELLAKFKAGATGFDLIQPSDYMVRQMVKLDMLSPVDHRLLTNLNHIDEFFTNLPYDPGLKHSVPFTWGTTGLAINVKRVKIPDDGVSWALLLKSPDPRHTSLLDDMREVFGVVFLSKGLSINTKDLKALEAARAEIGALKSKILMFTSEPRPLLAKSEITIAHTYSVDGYQASLDNPNVKYFIPKEGATLWTDNFAIPKSSAKFDDAHQFINYFLDPENAVKISSENHLATPNKTAKSKLPMEDTNNPSLYPPKEVLQQLQFIDDIGETLNKVNRMWTELKSS